MNSMVDLECIYHVCLHQLNFSAQIAISILQQHHRKAGMNNREARKHNVPILKAYLILNDTQPSEFYLAILE